MAYISALDDEEKDPQRPGLAAPAAGAPASAPQQPVNASRFVGFGRYLAANRDNAQHDADRVSQGLDTKGASAQQALDTAQQQFQTATNQPLAATAADRADATYTGPSALSGVQGWGAAQQHANEAQDAAGMTGTAGGVGALMGYGSELGQWGGKARLGSALTGNVGAEQFSKARERYGRLSDTLNRANGESVGQADAARQRVAASAQDARGQLQREAADKAARDAADAEMAKYRDMSFFDWTGGLGLGFGGPGMSTAPGLGSSVHLKEQTWAQMTPDERKALYETAQAGKSDSWARGETERYAKALTQKYGG